MNLSPGPWHASEPHPQTGECVITNGQGRVIARVPRAEDAAFICQARDTAIVDPTSTLIDWRAFGRQVQTARKAKRYSQQKAADLCGISRNYMSMIECGGVNEVGYTIVYTLCTWLGLEMPK